MNRPGMRWCRKVVEGTSVPLWCFCRKAQDTLASTTPFQQLRTCQVTAGARLCMANKSHGGAAGGLTGSKTLRRLWRKAPSSKFTFLIKWKVKGKLKAFPPLELSIWEEKQIFGRKAEFKDSQEFESAVSSGLEELSKKKCGDGSSQYSREEHRLFLAWLDEEDREFLVSSEGLGNSQKAEVAWLQRKGYPYTEVEVDISKWVETWSLRLFHHVSPTN